MENSEISLILSSAVLTLICAILYSTTPDRNNPNFNFHQLQLQEHLNNFND
ncbi:MAG: hypothetical protein ACFBSE_24880 [Prochloraceae cyanobacterium]